MLLLTLKGTPMFFMADEIGMEQVQIPPDRVQDPFERLVPGYGLNRDPQRVPMRWDGGKNGGFSSGEPWLPMGNDIGERNVAGSKSEDRSLLWLCRRLVELRRSEPVLIAGDYAPVRSRNDVLTYKRACGGEKILIALNTIHQPRKLDWEGEGTMLLSTYLDCEQKPAKGPMLLRPDEGVAIKLRR